MPSKPRTAAARTALALLILAGSFALAQPTGGSSEAEPDIVDAADDQLLFGVDPACLEGICVTGGGIDLLAAWLNNETATHLEVHIRTSSGDHASGLSGTPASRGSDTFTVGFTLNGTTYAGVARVGSDGVEAVGLPVVNATASGSLVTLVLSRAALAEPRKGAVLEGIQVLSSRNDPALPMPLANDQAPETGAPLVNYTFELDSLPSAPNGDGTTSRSSSTGGSTTSPGGASTSPGPGPTPPQATSSPTRAAPRDGDGSSTWADLTSDPGYLALSAVGFIAVLAVCMIGLVRWAK